MAYIDLKMQSLGGEPKSCCDGNFKRGDVMSAVVSNSGEPLGWYCQSCIDEWLSSPATPKGGPDD